ncbi:MAG TPA: 50S ribosomal protein L11 methyltransferase, partial [Puia sp.]|nr:50S ribosomal protein L11 methyltransferase [Puia sp.]
AILAERLGAAAVLAIDNDDWSIENAEENIMENNCMRIKTRKSDKIPVGTTLNIILSNINKHVLVHQMPQIGQQLAEGGVILMSGLLQEDFEDIENEAGSCRLSVFGRMTRGNWICLKMEKSN